MVSVGSGAEFSLPLRVYIEDTDAGGIVYYVNYLKYMERARTEFMRARGYGKRYVFNRDLMFVVRDAAITYLQPARLDDNIEATASIAVLRGAAIVFHQSVRRGGDILAQARITVACVDRAAGKPRRLPPGMVAELEPLVAEHS